MRVILTITSVIALLLISIGVGLEFRYTYGLIVAGAMAYVDYLMASGAAFLRSRDEHGRASQ